LMGFFIFLFIVMMLVSLMENVICSQKCSLGDCVQLLHGYAEPLMPSKSAYCPPATDAH